MSYCTVILWEPYVLILDTQNPCALRAQGGYKNSSQCVAKGGLAPKPFVTWVWPIGNPQYGRPKWAEFT